MELKKVNIIKEGSSKIDCGWEDTVTLNISTKQFPDIKGHKIGNIKMEIEGEITGFTFNKKRNKEDYTILIKKAAILNKSKNDGLSIDEKVEKIKKGR